MAEDTAPTGTGDDEEPKRVLNPIKIIRERLARRRLANESRLLKREDLMKQDLERFLMEIEERLSWVALELNTRNLERLKREEAVARIQRNESEKDFKEQLNLDQETGLSYYMGNIKGYKRYQNSAAKHLDLKGHTAAVHACKISPCFKYILSCSADKSLRLWQISNGRTVLIFNGHQKKIYDCDFHTNFKIDQKHPCILSCSGDTTLRLWNSFSEKSVSILKGHTEAVYRCSFSPDGQKIVSCSEDQTIRTWSYPDGFVIYVYRGHQSPVTCVTFSPTGRYILSASDYGERKLLLWNSTMPLIEDPIHYPHMIFWTGDGLIKKMLIRKMIPPHSFWLTQDQMELLGEDVILEMWPGELEPDEVMDSDSGTDDDDDDEDENEVQDEEEGDGVDKIDVFYKDDIDDKGIAFLILATDRFGERSEAKEYVPGGSLVISVQSMSVPISEAYVSVMCKETKFDAFKSTGGHRLGVFKVQAPLPWQVENIIVDPLGLRPPKRVAPLGYKETNDSQGFLFRDPEELEIAAKAVAALSPHKKQSVAHGKNTKQNEEGEEVMMVQPPVQTVWMCPSPNYGGLVVTVNLRLRDTQKWIRVTRSLKESAVRINSKSAGPDNGEEEGAQPARFDFDQESRHVAFWDFVREKNWDGVMAFFDKKAVLYKDKVVKKRRWRVVDTLEKMFENVPGLILSTPFMFRSGTTKSSVMVQNVPIDWDEGEDDEAEVDVEEAAVDVADEESVDIVREVSDLEEDNNEAADNEKSVALELDAPQDVNNNDKPVEIEVQETTIKEDLAPGQVYNESNGDIAGQEELEEDGAEGDEEEEDDGNDKDKSSKPELHTIVHPNLHESLSQVLEEDEEDIEDEEDDVKVGTKTNQVDDALKEKIDPQTGRPSLAAFGDNLSDLSMDSMLQGLAPGESIKDLPPGGAVTNGHKDEKHSLIASDAVISVPVAQSSSAALAPTAQPEPIIRSTVNFSEPLLSDKAANVDVLMSSAQPTDPAPLISAITHKIEPLVPPLDTQIAQQGSHDDVDLQTLQSEEVMVRQKTRKLMLPKIIFCGEIEGKKFDKQVFDAANLEALDIQILKLKKVAYMREMRTYGVSDQRKSELCHLPQTPAWTANYKKTSQQIKESENASSKKTLNDELKKLSAELADKHVYFFNIASNHMVKSGRFGPDIEQFTMPLPPHFPHRAGQAVNALRAPLQDYGKILARMNENRLPLSLEEAENRRNWLKSSNKAQELLDLQESLKEDIRFSMLSERSYDSKRRNALPVLPGMSCHYPNEHYKEPALAYPFQEDPVIEESSYLSVVFGKKKISKGIIVGPVGRRPVTVPPPPPLPPPPPAVGTIRPATAPPPSTPQHASTHVDSETMKPAFAFRPKPSSKNQAQEISVTFRPRTSTHITSPRNNSQAQEVTVRPRTSTHATSPRNSQAQDVTTSENIVTRISEGSEGESIDGNVHSESASMDINMQRIIEQNAARAKKLNLPKGVFMERRGSFACPPGLEQARTHAVIEKTSEAMALDAKLGNSDDKAADAVIDGDEIIVDDMISVADSVTKPFKFVRVETRAGRLLKAQKAVLNMTEDDIDCNETGGLVRRFRVNHFEIAHHGAVNDAVFSPSEARVASAGGDNLIKVWDPRDGTYVRTLTGHSGPVCGLQYSKDELYLVSCAADSEILIWDMTTVLVVRRLRGHHDIVCRVAINDDCSFLVSCSHDNVVKTWFTTPRHPDAPEPPRLISKTDTNCLLAWNAPPCFNLEPTAYNIQYRIGLRDAWGPDPALSVAPQFRSKVVENLVAATPYQFRIRAVNKMGIGPWSAPTKLIDTAFGIPEALDQPCVCASTCSTMTIYWFAPNPATYGSASKLFEVQYTGDGLGFDKYPTLQVTIEDGLLQGHEVMQRFEYYLNHVRTAAPGKAINKVLTEVQQSGFNVAFSDVEKTIERAGDESLVFIAAKVQNLKPGLIYKFQTRAINPAGAGAWSRPSFSSATLPREPDVPAAPHIVETGLTNITFGWHTPTANGASISGFSLQIEHNSKVLEIPRNQSTYLLDGLQPGKAFRIRISAKNLIGVSEYSEWSDKKLSRTRTDCPEQARGPVPVSGTWCSIVISSVIPFGNGSYVTSLIVQKRIIQPFDVGYWETSDEMIIPNDVTIVELIDEEKRQQDMYAAALAESQQRRPKNYNPFKADKTPHLTVEQILANQKPEGSKIEFEMKMLLPDTMYEFRVCYRNATGVSEYSPPSQRAKTNKAEMPSKCPHPRLSMIMPTSITISIINPLQGGALIHQYLVETRNSETSTVVLSTHKREIMTSKTFQCHITGLMPMNCYQFRILAENKIGRGEYSVWSDEIDLPSDTNIISESDPSSRGRSRTMSEVGRTPRTARSRGMSEIDMSSRPRSPISTTSYSEDDYEDDDMFDLPNLDPTQALHDMAINLPPSSSHRMHP